MEAGLFVYGRNATGLSIMKSFVGEYEPYFYRSREDVARN